MNSNKPQRGTVYESDMSTKICGFSRLPMGRGFNLVTKDGLRFYNSAYDIKQKYPGCVMILDGR